MATVYLSDANNGPESVVYNGTHTGGTSGTFTIYTGNYDPNKGPHHTGAPNHTPLPPCGYTVQLIAWDRMRCPILREEKPNAAGPRIHRALLDDPSVLTRFGAVESAGFELELLVLKTHGDHVIGNVGRILPSGARSALPATPWPRPVADRQLGRAPDRPQVRNTDQPWCLRQAGAHNGSRAS